MAPSLLNASKKVALAFAPIARPPPPTPEYANPGVGQGPKSLLAIKEGERSSGLPPRKTPMSLISAVNEVINDPRRGLVIDVNRYTRKNNSLILTYLARKHNAKDCDNPKAIKELSALLKYKIKSAYPWLQKVLLVKDSP